MRRWTWSCPGRSAGNCFPVFLTATTYPDLKLQLVLKAGMKKHPITGIFIKQLPSAEGKMDRTLLQAFYIWRAISNNISSSHFRNWLSVHDLGLMFSAKSHARLNINILHFRSTSWLRRMHLQRGKQSIKINCECPNPIKSTSLSKHLNY